ncbi:MAG: YraN family protein [Candidatus Kapabacteria bacterium]|nr:YraN family protein [Candidatus Kapabacteria bacterium]
MHFARNNMATDSQNSTRGKGAEAEDIAADFLVRLGYTIVKRNFHFGKTGEIDIVARDGETLVFVEVKSRSGDEYGTPEDAITMKKRAQLRKVAQGYLYVNAIENVECRFDAIAIDFTKHPADIRHYVNAFW